MRLKRLFAFAIVAGLGAVAIGNAQAADDPAVATVRTVYASFATAVAGGGIKDRLAAIEKTMAETFDFPAMIRIAVGAKWKSFTPEQQGALTEAFAQYFTTTYANRLAQAKGGKFVVKPASEARGTGRSVETEVSNGEGDTSQVDFLVGAGNRVQDVYLNGNVSELAAMRASFGDSLKAGGADELLKFLRERTTGMLAAKPAP